MNIFTFIRGHGLYNIQKLTINKCVLQEMTTAGKTQIPRYF